MCYDSNIRYRIVILYEIFTVQKVKRMDIKELDKEKAIGLMTKNLPVLRTMLHISQAELAELLGIGRQTLVAFETGKRTMTWNTFLSLLFVFSQREETRGLLPILGIYSEDLQAVYGGRDQ